MKNTPVVLALLAMLISLRVFAQEITAHFVEGDLSKMPVNEKIWKFSKPVSLTLLAQPMALPRPATTTTSVVFVEAVHNGTWIAFRLKWKDSDRNETGILGTFSDAVAIQFPGKEGDLPPIFMGAKDNPVQIYHWRAEYQRDEANDVRRIQDLYPNAEVDIYPLEFKDHGNIPKINIEQREVFLPGRAAGNPQSYQKRALDEVFAEGFGTSEVIESSEAKASGEWKKSHWNVVISRPLHTKRGADLRPGKEHFIAFAVWQGGKREVGGRKSVTMNWTPLGLQEKGKP